MPQNAQAPALHVTECSELSDSKYVTSPKHHVPTKPIPKHHSSFSEGNQYFYLCTKQLPLPQENVQRTGAGLS